MQRHGRRGVLVYRLDNNDDKYMNARHMCTLFHDVRTDQVSLESSLVHTYRLRMSLRETLMGSMVTSDSVRT